jgi:hypothetical protein
MSDAKVHVGKVIGSKPAAILNADAFVALSEIVGAAREYGRIRQEEQQSARLLQRPSMSRSTASTRPRRF